MSVLRVELVSPERVAYSGVAKMVIARTVDGDIAFLPGHVPFIGVLDTHQVRMMLEEGGEQLIAVHQGFVEVSPGETPGESRVTILSDVCELSADIDVARANIAKTRAEEQLRLDSENATAQAALMRAEVRLTVAGS